MKRVALAAASSQQPSGSQITFWPGLGTAGLFASYSLQPPLTEEPLHSEEFLSVC